MHWIVFLGVLLALVLAAGAYLLYLLVKGGEACGVMAGLLCECVKGLWENK